MNLHLTPIEARVIGALVEKEITTPDQYPLSLNSLVAACNQKTNRDPVLELDERAVQDTLDALAKRYLVMERSGFGSRVLKYRHRLCNGDHNPLQFSPQELAIVGELLLRGPQTPGELRSRAQRLAPFADLGQVEATLERLATREDGPFVVKLARQPGAREARYAQLFTGAPAEAAHGDGWATPAAAGAGSAATGAALAETGAGARQPSDPGSLAARVAALESELASVRAELTSVRAELASVRAELASVRTEVAALRARPAGVGQS
jgi:uncharacterized protein YceH (UPF0502 family)